MLEIVLCKDINLIKEIDDACFGVKSYSLEQYQQMSIGKFYVMKKGLNNIGFVILNKISDDYELIKIGILQQYRHQGYATIFLKYLLEQLSFSKFFLEVSEKNIHAINLYTKLNFKEIYRRKKYYNDGTDAIIMQYLK